MTMQPTAAPARSIPGTTRFALSTLVALGALLGSAAERTQALTMFDKEVTCPIGGQTLKTKAVAIYRQTGMRLDSKPLGSLVAPMPYPVCPENGFVMYKDEFSEDELATLRPIVLSETYRQARQEHTDHYMAAF